MRTTAIVRLKGMPRLDDTWNQLDDERLARPNRPWDIQRSGVRRSSLLSRSYRRR